MVWKGCQEGVGRLSGWYRETDWMVWRHCLDVVEWLSGGCGESLCLVPGA